MLGYCRTSRFTLAHAMVIVTMLLGLLAFQDPARNTGQAAAENDIRELLDRFFKLAKENDWDELAGLYADDCKMFADGATVFDKQAYMDLLQGDELLVRDWSLSNLQIEVADDRKSAWCRYQGHFDHGEFKVSTAETVIFRFRQAWEITHAHASVKVLDEGKTDD